MLGCFNACRHDSLKQVSCLDKECLGDPDNTKLVGILREPVDKYVEQDWMLPLVVALAPTCNSSTCLPASALSGQSPRCTFALPPAGTEVKERHLVRRSQTFSQSTTEHGIGPASELAMAMELPGLVFIAIYTNVVRFCRPPNMWTAGQFFKIYNQPSPHYLGGCHSHTGVLHAGSFCARKAIWGMFGRNFIS